MTPFIHASPRRVAVIYTTLVFAAWILALSPLSHFSTVEALPILVGLPWSLLFLDGGGLGLFGLFLTGLMNGCLLYFAAWAWRRASLPPRRRLLLPPAA